MAVGSVPGLPLSHRPWQRKLNVAWVTLSVSWDFNFIAGYTEAIEVANVSENKNEDRGDFCR